MSKARLAVIEGGGARERISGEILKEILKPDFDQQRVEELVAQLKASPKPTLELLVSDSGTLVCTPEPSLPQDSKGDTCAA